MSERCKLIVHLSSTVIEIVTTSEESELFDRVCFGVDSPGDAVVSLSSMGDDGTRRYVKIRASQVTACETIFGGSELI